jgi:hypothetical protein
MSAFGVECRPGNHTDHGDGVMRLRRTNIFRWLGVVALFCFGATAHAQRISPKATSVIAAIDALDVEHHWPAGLHVNWETGQPDGRPESGNGKHTHCSAFVAAAAKQFGIYILRPPEHPQILLANAQYDWLQSEGARRGWRAVNGAVEAQELANRGEFVVAAYQNSHADKPGHIAIVRPSDRSEASVSRDGPEITQAGLTNHHATTLAQGFAGHPAAWGRHEVRFYAHAVALVDAAPSSRARSK